MKRALLIGIDQYDNFNDLGGCVNDVSALEPLLSRNEDDSPNFDCQKRASDTGGVTRDALLADLDALLAGGAEIAVLYFAGHGAGSGDDEASDQHRVPRPIQGGDVGNPCLSHCVPRKSFAEVQLVGHIPDQLVGHGPLPGPHPRMGQDAQPARALDKGQGIERMKGVLRNVRLSAIRDELLRGLEGAYSVGPTVFEGVDAGSCPHDPPERLCCPVDDGPFFPYTRAAAE